MRRTVEMMRDFQKTNIDEDGITFTKEDFTQLYNAVIKDNWEVKKHVKIDVGLGAIGGLSVAGLAVLGVQAYKKLKSEKDGLS